MKKKPRDLTAEDVRDRLRDLIKQNGSQRACAEQLGISPTYLSGVLVGGQEPGEKLLYALGLERVLVYREIIHG